MIINKFLPSKITNPQKENSDSTSRISRRFFIKSFSACGLILLSGCQTSQNTGPQIYTGYGQDDFPVPEEVIIDRNPPSGIRPSSNVPSNWYPPKSVEKDWDAIIIHHSATEFGNMAIFDKEHKNKGWDGVGYDFIIGNGRDSGDGEIEVTERWIEQKTGAHCKTPGNWANEEGIGICLVGNFNNRRPSQRQMDSLVKLTDFLQRRYGIYQSRIYGHGDTPGANVTDCPGNSFPMVAFKSSLNF